MNFGINLLLLAGTVIITLMAFQNRELFHNLKFNAYLIKQKKQSWRFFSYALVHADWLHLLVNMYVLYSFGGMVEHIFQGVFGNIGILYYLLLYVGGVIFSTLFDYWKQKDNPYYNAVGASGAVSAIIFASILLVPEGSIYIFPIPFALPSWVFGGLYLVYSAYMGKKGIDNIGHNAHLWGAVFGIVYTIILIPGTISNFISEIF